MSLRAAKIFLVKVFDAKDGRLLKQMGHNEGIDGLAWSHDGQFLASGEEESLDNRSNKQGLLTLFKMPEGEIFKQVNFGDTINSIDFSYDDKYVLAAGHLGRLNVYKVPSLELVKEFQGDPEVHLISARFSPDLKLVACGDNDGYYFIWEFESGKPYDFIAILAFSLRLSN